MQRYVYSATRSFSIWLVIILTLCLGYAILSALQPAYAPWVAEVGLIIWVAEIAVFLLVQFRRSFGAFYDRNE